MANIPIAAEVSAGAESSRSGVTWGAIFAGALAAAATTAIMTLLGSGLGLSMVSPWAGESAAPATVVASAAVWLVVVQWFSSGIGGYLAGRLRTKWAGIHTDEVFFRDTTHGFMAWALASLLVIGIAGSSTHAVLRGVTASVSSVAGSALGASANAAGGNAADISGYFVDTLLRPTDAARLATAAPADPGAAAQITRILAMGAAAGEIAPADRDYLAKLVAARAGLSEADAQARIDTVLKAADDWKAKAQAAADAARKVAATTAILGALSLLIGAFIASVAGAIGGRQRDDYDALMVERF